jgi:hypothetical protein
VLYLEETPMSHRDFDFLWGRWTVRASRRKEWLADCEEWVDFDAELTTWPLLDGHANVDDFRAEWGEGLVGSALRLFDAATGTWSIYWLNKANPVMDASPVVGSFAGDRGVFQAEDTWDGQAILVRFVWSRVNDAVPHWEQAFSTDGGETWETNWVMDYVRVESA